MSLLNDFLVEAVTTPYPWKWEKNGMPFDPDQDRQEMLALDPPDGGQLHRGSYIDYDAVFRATNAALHVPLLGKQGIGYRVSFYSDDSYLTPRRSRERWTLDFGIVAASVFDLRRAGIDIEGMYAVTGTGDSFRVMATVIDIVRAFIATEHPSEIQFSAKERSRRKLYERLLALVSKHIPGYRGVSKYAGEYAIKKTGWVPNPPLRGDDEFFQEPPDDDPSWSGSEEDVAEAMQSQAQRRWMWATHPKMAKKWEKETPKGPLPDHVKESSIVKVLETLAPLTEVLGNAPYPWQWEGGHVPDASLGWSNRNEIRAHFQAGEIEYTVHFERNGRREGNGLVLRWYHDTRSASGAAIQSSPHWLLSFDVDQTSMLKIPWAVSSDEMTGTGNSIRIYTTVIAILSDFIKRVSPLSVEFDGNPEDAPSRVSFYTRLINAINARSIFPGYRGERGGKTDDGHEIFGIVSNEFRDDKTEETLHEVIQTPYSYRWTQTQSPAWPATSGSYAAKFKTDTDDDLEFDVWFYQEIYMGFTPAKWIMGFRLSEDSIERLERQDRQIDSPYALTGTGDAFRIFSTVVKILQDFIQREKPDEVVFESEESEPSRTKLYHRLVKHVRGHIPGYRGYADGGEQYGVRFHIEKLPEEPTSPSPNDSQQR